MQTKPIALLFVLLTLTVGCQPQAASDSAESSDGHGHGHGHGHDHDHDHGSRPATLTAAVAQLTEIRNEVQSAMRGGTPDDAHHALHEVGELLEMLPEIAADTDLPREKWEEAKAETDKLFDAFGVVDEAFHTADGDKPAAYEKVAAQIDESIASLTALLPLAGETVSDHDHDEDHDHDHGDDHDHDDDDHDHEADHDHDK